MCLQGSHSKSAAFSFVYLLSTFPDTVRCPSAEFLADLGVALHPQHGSVILNLHGGGPGSLSLTRLLKGRGRHGAPGFRPDTPAGAAVARIAAEYKCVIISNSNPLDCSAAGVSCHMRFTRTFTLSFQLLGTTCLCAYIATLFDLFLSVNLIYEAPALSRRVSC